MTIIVPVTPLPKQRVRVVNGHAYTPKRTVQFERLIGTATASVHVTGAVALDLVFKMPMPKSWSKAKRQRTNGKPHCQTPDTDNLIKAVMDGMKNCWSDDKIVYQVSGTKLWAEQPEIIINVKEQET